jgi:mono/diheme cytochrome c family protein
MTRAHFRLRATLGVAIGSFAAVLAAQGAGAGMHVPQGRGVLSGPGPGEKHIVDRAGAERGRTVWAAECITCHGTQARGTDRGPNLMRSLVLLRDRNASELGPYLKRGHDLQSGRPGTSLTDAQVQDVSHFLHQRLNEVLAKSIDFFKPEGVLTGDAKAGAAFFAGEGKCTACHSATGNLAGIAARYDPVTVQQRFLFPTGRGRGAAPNAAAVTVTVTPASGPVVSGVLVQLDDFDVTLRDANGTTRTFRRSPALKVVKTDPLQAHRLLLDTITDKQIHDLVAYLVTLK